ncbi:MAG: VWA domain-containing protein, partial [Euryarchaeota archaeon]|nr:VWA domain-containing protein [Euryarchaeota archaeon]
IEERDLTVYIILDVSASNEFGSEQRKRDYGVEIAASLIFSALANNDSVGMFLCTSEVEEFIPPRKGRSHLFKLLREMIYFEPEKKTTDLNNCIRYISNVAKRRSIMFVVSDFFTEDFEKSLGILKNRHEVILINVSDVRESDIPDIGYAMMEDGETGEQFLVNTSDERFRQNYVEIMDQRNRLLSEKMKRLKVDMINIRTDQPFEISLRRFFRLKEKRMR